MLAVGGGISLGDFAWLLGLLRGFVIGSAISLWELGIGGGRA